MKNQSSTMPMAFNYGDAVVRSITIDENPWFVGKDVCEYFGDSHYNRSLSRLDDDEKGMTPIDTPRGKQKMTIINESGLYHLMFLFQPEQGNNKELATKRQQQVKAFRKWVTGEVLPAIRREGKYDPLKQRMAVLRKDRHGHRLAIERAKYAIKQIDKEMAVIDSRMGHICPECGKVCASAKSLAAHIKAAHRGGAENLLRHQKDPQARVD